MVSDSSTTPGTRAADDLGQDDLDTARLVYFFVEAASFDRHGERRLTQAEQREMCSRLIKDFDITRIHTMATAASTTAALQEGIAPALRALAPTLATQSRVISELIHRMALPEFDGAWSDIDDPAAVADRMLATVPRHHPANVKIGPFYDLTGVAKWRHLTRQGVHAQVKKRDLLALRTKDNVILLPAFQFNVKGEPLPRLREVLLSLDPGDRHPEGSALWLNTKAKALDGKTPAEVLRTRRAQDAVDIARRIGAAAAA